MSTTGPRISRREQIGMTRRAIQRRRRNRRRLIFAVVAVLIAAGIAVSVYFMVSSSSSGTQQVASKYVSYSRVNGTEVATYVIIFTNGTKATTQSKSLYNDIQVGGGYNKSTNTVLSPAEEQQVINDQSGTSHVSNGNPVNDDPEHVAPVDPEPAPVEHEPVEIPVDPKG